MTTAKGSIIVRQAPKDGEQGISVTNVVRYYLATSAGSGVTTATAGWTTTPQSPTVTNKYIWTYDKTYFSNSTTSVTTPSIAGVYGDTGVTGLSVRQTEWAEGFEYRNDSNLTTSPRYLDIVAVLSTSGLYTDAAGQKYTLYQAKEAHNGVTSAARNKPGSGASWQTYWDQLNQLKPIYTPLLLAQLIKAQQIDVDNLIVKNVNAIDAEGYTSCSIDGSTGKLTAQNAEITGKINAVYGTIGGFEIGNGRIGIDSGVAGSGNGMFLYNDVIGFNATNKQAVIGPYAPPAAAYRLGSFTNTTTSRDRNYGLIFNINNSYEANYAIAGKGDAILNGNVEGYRLNRVYSPATSSIAEIDISKGTRMIIDNTAGGDIHLPRISLVRSYLGLSTDDRYTPFAVRLTFMHTGSSSHSTYVYGRTTSIAFLNSNIYPYIRDNNYGNPASINMNNGDTLELMLTWNGVFYDAYKLGNMT